MLSILPFILAILLITVSWHYQTRYMVQNYKKYSSVSHMYKLPKFRNSFRTGLILTGIMQILFVLSIHFHPTLFEIDIGKMFFLVGALGAILLGLVSRDEQLIIHLFASCQYFFGLAIGAVIITVNYEIPNYIQIISLGVVGLWGVVIMWQILYKNGFFVIETFHVLLSYVWILLIAATQLLY